MFRNMHKTVNVTFSNRKFTIIHPYLSLCSLFVFMFSLKIQVLLALQMRLAQEVHLVWACRICYIRMLIEFTFEF